MDKVTTLEKSLYEPPPRREEFYTDVIEQLAASEIPFLLSGTYALAFYTGIVRPTKDVDVFATAGDCLKILSYFKSKKVDVEIVDDRWLARITKGEIFVDVIFNMPTASTHVTEDWFDNSPRAELFGTEVHLVPPHRVRLVQDVRPGPLPLRWCRRCAHDPQASLGDRLAAPAQPHGIALGSAADAPSQLPLHLSQRAGFRSAVASR
jgi:hypothetical protein